MFRVTLKLETGNSNGDKKVNILTYFVIHKFSKCLAVIQIKLYKTDDGQQRTPNG